VPHVLQCGLGRTAPKGMALELDRQAAHAELERVRHRFADHVEQMTREDLRERSDGTRWTNRQLLFHMLFGYLLVRTLVWMVKVLGRLPRWTTKPFAALLNVCTRPFHWINYLGSVLGGTALSPQRMQRRFDRVTAGLQRDMDRQNGQSLDRGMCYPGRWDPYFKDFMTLADIYRYPTQHFDHHDRQLSR
jgi:hypothetical protein